MDTIGDLFDEQSFDADEELRLWRLPGTRVWKYPFAAVRPRYDEATGTRRWVIDLFDTLKEGISALVDRIEVGDQVADIHWRHEPYWEVVEVDEDTSRIYVTPIGNNPFVTMVGAGGAPITDHDLAVFAGDIERQRVDRVLDLLRSGQVYSYDDVAYVLLGTVPVQMGPNGAQGGWYNSSDTWSNRGGRKGMTPAEIQAADALTLQRMGLPVPPAALAGAIPPSIWNDLAGHSSAGFRVTDPTTLFPGEDLRDPDAMLRMIATHPLVWVKGRNFKALQEYAKPFPRKAFDAASDPVLAAIGTPDEAAVRKQVDAEQDRLRHVWRIGKLAVDLPALEAGIRMLAALPAPESWDVYWLVREVAILEAQDQQRIDLVRLFERASDPANRRYVANAYFELGYLKGIWRMFHAETHPEAMRGIMSALRRSGADILALAEMPHVRAVLTPVPDDIVGNYERAEIERMLAEARWRREMEELLAQHRRPPNVDGRSFGRRGRPR